MDFADLAANCAPFVHPQTLAALVKTESGFNPNAIGVVRARLARQPRNSAEAVATVQELERRGFNYSVGLAQVNKYNFARYGLTAESAFDPCNSLRAGGLILLDCFQSAQKQSKTFPTEQHALRAAFSCYYSGNFRTGFRPDFKGQPSYVDKVVASAIPLEIFKSKSSSSSRTLRSTPAEATLVANSAQPQASDSQDQRPPLPQ